MTFKPIVQNIALDLIVPGSQQARRHFDSDALDELAISIKESGIVQPLVVRSLGGGFEILAGERRWRAAQRAGLDSVPAIVRDDLSEDEAYVVGLIENLQREALSPMEAAHGLKRLSTVHKLTHEELAERIGKSRVYVTHVLRLLTLEKPVQEWVDQGQLSLGHAKVLGGVSALEQTHWAAEAMRNHWTVRTLERRLANAQPRRAKPRKDADWQNLEQGLSELLGSPVSITADAQGHGELRVGFHSLEALDGVLERLGYRVE